MPSLVFTVTVPSSATVISAFANPKVLLAAITASATLSFSSEVNDFRSFTSTGVGFFKVSSASAFFSQTAYTVLGAVTLSKIPSVGAVASFLSAQPLNSYPSLVGSAGFVTLPLSTFTVVVSLPSVNLP